MNFFLNMHNNNNNYTFVLIILKIPLNFNIRKCPKKKKKKQYNGYPRTTIISRKQVASINYIGLVKLITRVDHRLLKSCQDYYRVS